MKQALLRKAVFRSSAGNCRRTSTEASFKQHQSIHAKHGPLQSWRGSSSRLLPELPGAALPCISVTQTTSTAMKQASSKCSLWVILCCFDLQFSIGSPATLLFSASLSLIFFFPCCYLLLGLQLTILSRGKVWIFQGCGELVLQVIAILSQL